MAHWQVMTRGLKTLLWCLHPEWNCGLVRSRHLHLKGVLSVYADQQFSPFSVFAKSWHYQAFKFCAYLNRYKNDISWFKIAFSWLQLGVSIHMIIAIWVSFFNCFFIFFAYFPTELSSDWLRSSLFPFTAKIFSRGTYVYPHLTFYSSTHRTPGVTVTFPVKCSPQGLQWAPSF